MNAFLTLRLRASLALCCISLLALTACPSQPEEIEHDDVGIPDDTGADDVSQDDDVSHNDTGAPDTGDEPDTGTPDTGDEPDTGDDADVEEPLDCTVPHGSKDLAQAVDAGCEVIEIDGNLDIGDLGIGVDDEAPILIDRDLTILGAEHRIYTLPHGLFEVTDGAHLTLEHLTLQPLSMTPDDETLPAMVTVSEDSSLTTEGVTFIGSSSYDQVLLAAHGATQITLSQSRFDELTGELPALHLVDSPSVTLEAVTIANSSSSTAGPLVMSCEDSAVEFSNGTSVTGHSITLNGPETEGGDPFPSIDLGLGDDEATGEMQRGSLVSLDGCDLTIDNSSIDGNEFAIEGYGLDATMLSCFNGGSVTMENGASISANSVVVDIAYAVGDLDLRATADLDGCDFTATGSELKGNSKDLTIVDFDSEVNNDHYHIQFHGGAVGASNGSSVTLTGTSVKSNQLGLAMTNEEDSAGVPIIIIPFLYFSGGGINIDGGDLLIQDSEISHNSIETYFSGDVWPHQRSVAGAGVNATNSDVKVIGSMINNNFTTYSGINREIDPTVHGVGLAYRAEHGTLEILGSTISENEVETAGDVRGTGVSFISSGDAQLHLVNSTISHNSADDADVVLGGGLYVAGPGFDAGPVANADDFAKIRTDDEIPLSAVIRYSTIAFNTITDSDENSAGAGIYVDQISGDVINSDDRAIVSLIGLLLHGNEINSAVYDCAGQALLAEVGADDSLIDGIENGSGWNRITPSLASSQQSCAEQLGGSASRPGLYDFTDQSFVLSADLTNPDGLLPGVLIPQPFADPGGAIGAVDGGEVGQCSGVFTAAHLDTDQTGFPRADDETCDVGAVEWREGLGD